MIRLIQVMPNDNNKSKLLQDDIYQDRVLQENSSDLQSLEEYWIDFQIVEHIEAFAILIGPPETHSIYYHQDLYVLV